MIELEEVTRTFRGARGGARAVRALEDVSLSLPGGQVTAVVGPNGAGKTTLFAVLLGFLRPSAGEVRIEGEAPRRYVRRHGVAYLPDRFLLPDGWRVRPGLLALARLEGIPAGEAARRVDAALERFALGAHALRPARDLSAGLLQRVGLAQATVAERRLVVLDEPAQGLDPLWRVRLRDWVEELRRAGCTVLLASHDLAEVERVADRVVLLEAGRVREVIQKLAQDPGERRYRIVLTEPLPGLAGIFPDAIPEEDGLAWVVRLKGSRELSQRLSAVLSMGATVEAVEPLREGLEARVRRTLSEDDR